jgi:quinol monooxygenase YgiN
MIHTFVRFRAVDGKSEQFEAINRRLLTLISAADGCFGIDVHRSIAEPGEYMVHGRWESKDAWVRAHQTSEEFRRLFAELPIERHDLSRVSFFEPVYCFNN